MEPEPKQLIKAPSPQISFKLGNLLCICEAIIPLKKANVINFISPKFSILGKQYR